MYLSTETHYEDNDSILFLHYISKSSGIVSKVENLCSLIDMA